MNILGLNLSHDSGVCLLSEGRITYAINEERISRVKLDHRFPDLAIRQLFRDTALTPDQIDHVAWTHVGAYPLPFLWEGLQIWPFTVKRFMVLVRMLVALIYLILPRPLAVDERLANWALRRVLKRRYGIAAPITRHDHHLAHAASAYYTSGLDEGMTGTGPVVVVTSDGAGDRLSASINRVDNGILERTASVGLAPSLGFIYTDVTERLGYKPFHHEGKITGLAAYGDSGRYVDRLHAMLVWDEHGGYDVGAGLVARYRRTAPRRQRLAVWFARLVAAPAEWRELAPRDAVRHTIWTCGTDSHMDTFREDLAAAVQVFCEEVVVRWLGSYLRRRYPGQKASLAIAGGLFANVKINQRLREMPEVASVYIHPHMGDGGLSVGAALQALAAMGQPVPPYRWPHCFLGTSYTEDDMAAALAASSLAYQRHDDIEERIAGLLAEGRVVALFAGAMEYGPRALCHRSILCPATDPAINTWLNERLRRTEFMPFAPVLCKEDAPDYFLGFSADHSHAAEFMTITYDVTERMAQEAPAAVHVDHTARPQIVTSAINPSIVKILKAYTQRTGLRVLINTSFNLHGEPIVHSPADAIRSFRAGHLDALALGPFLVLNHQPDQASPS